jgi:membrane-associated protein
VVTRSEGSAPAGKREHLERLSGSDGRAWAGRPGDVAGAAGARAASCRAGVRTGGDVLWTEPAAGRRRCGQAAAGGVHAEGVMTHLAERILLLPPVVALLLVFALPALEASAFVGFIVPGEIGVILGGVLANQHKLPLWAALVAGIAGAVIGDSVGYEVGKRYGERILTKIPNRILKQEHLDRAKESVRRNGGKAVFVGRFTAALRVLVPGFSGMSRIPYGTFLAWNAAGGALWATAFVLLGYAAGSQYQRVAHNASLFGIALLLVIAAVIVVKRLRSRSKAPTGT